MNLFETTAYAAEAGGGSAGYLNLLFLGGFVLIFYFLLIRPQSKRRKEHQALMAGVGQVSKVEDDFVKVKVASQIELRLQKSAVSATLPKGTLKSLDEG